MITSTSLSLSTLPCKQQHADLHATAQFHHLISNQATALPTSAPQIPFSFALQAAACSNNRQQAAT
jgi:hypothetical protein